VLTKGEGKVKKMFAENKMIELEGAHSLTKANLTQATGDLIKESFIFNCTEARIEMDLDGMYRPKGNLIDSAIIQLLLDNDILLFQFRFDREENLLLEIPFDSNRMRVTTIMRVPRSDGVVRVYIKGAPEIILTECKHLFNANGERVKITEHDKRNLLHDHVNDSIAKQGLKPLAVAYKEMTFDQYVALRARKKI